MEDVPVETTDDLLEELVADLTANPPEGLAPDQCRPFATWVHAMWDEGVKAGPSLPLRPIRKAPAPVIDPMSLPYLLSVDLTASVLATTPEAVRARVERGQLTGFDGLVRTGRKIQFLRDRLLRALERAADDQAPKKARAR